jgi:hypothetical protein
VGLLALLHFAALATRLLVLGLITASRDGDFLVVADSNRDGFHGFPNEKAA